MWPAPFEEQKAKNFHHNFINLIGANWMVSSHVFSWISYTSALLSSHIGWGASFYHGL